MTLTISDKDKIILKYNKNIKINYFKIILI